MCNYKLQSIYTDMLSRLMLEKYSGAIFRMPATVTIVSIF
jgi:hypothetical protein